MKENRLDGLYLGRQDGDELTYAGKVDHGFSSDLAPKFYPAVSSLLAFGFSQVPTASAYLRYSDSRKTLGRRFFHSSQVIRGSSGNSFKIRRSPAVFRLAFSLQAGPPPKRTAS
jgi:hypothetical protein